jgi:hypothetical protein
MTLELMGTLEVQLILSLLLSVRSLSLSSVCLPARQADMHSPTTVVHWDYLAWGTFKLGDTKQAYLIEGPFRRGRHLNFAHIAVARLAQQA